MTMDAVIFVGIGTLAEVGDLDRTAWNAAFRSHNIDWNWSWDTYAELMRPGGDRQLAARYAAHLGRLGHPGHPDHPVGADALDRTHQKHFATMLAGGVPLRPGVARVMSWAARSGIRLALVSRSETDPVRALLIATARARGGTSFDVAILREDVDHMAPHPEALDLALRELGITADRAVAVADTRVSLEAAQAASLPRLGFPGRLAEAEPGDFAGIPIAHVLTPEALLAAWRDDACHAAE